MTGESGSSEDVRLPIDQVLPGMEIHPLPEGSTPLEAFVVVKFLDERGEVTWGYRTTNRLNREELLGAMVVQSAVLRKELVAEWDDEDA